MIIKDIYLKKAKLSSLNGAIIFFTNEKFEINNTQRIINSKEKDIFKKNLKKVDSKKNIFSFDYNHNQKVIFLALKKNQSQTYFENQGAKIFNFLKNENIKKVNILCETLYKISNTNLIYSFIHGMKLKSYHFDKYLSKKKLWYN